MALIKCPKCGKEFSDRAQACPQCGTSKEEVQRLIKEQAEKAAEQERIRQKREAEERKKYIKFAVALVIVLFTLFCGYVVYINTMPISARNSTELQSALQNPLRFSKDSFKVRIPRGVTSIEYDAFEGCKGIISVTIPNSVTSIGQNAFSGCTGLPIIDNVRYADTYLVKAVDKTLSTYSIKKGTKWIGDWAFKDCKSLTSIEIPNSVTSIGGNAFENCTGLTSVTIPNGVTSIGDFAFRNCTGLTSVTISSSVTSIGQLAFYGCTALISLTIPNSVTSIEDVAFGSIPNIVYNGSAAGTPWGARSLNGFVEGWFVYSNDTRNNLLACSSSASGEVSIPNSVTTIGDRAFCDCSSMTSIEIPNSVTNIGEEAFTDCEGLTSVTIPNSVINIGSDAFCSCSGLIAIEIPHNVINIGDFAFRCCRGLTSVTIPNSVTSIGYNAFCGCTSLTLKIPERFRGKVNVSDCKEVIYY